MNSGGAGILAATRHPTVRLAGALAVMLAAFWLLFYPVFIAPKSDPVDFIPVGDFAYAAPEAADPGALDAADFNAASPGSEHRTPGLHALRGTFELGTVPRDGLGLLAISGGDNVLHFVNGAQVAGRGAMEPGKLDYRANLRTIGHVPASALRTGSNTVTAIIAIETPREVLLAPPLLAEYPDALAAFAWKEFLQTDYLKISVTLSLFLALLIAAVATRSSARRLTLWLLALVAGWGLYSLIPIWISFPISGAARIWCHFAAFVLLSLAWPVFVDEWTGRPLRFFKPLVLIFTGGVAVLGTFYAISAPDYFTASFVHDAMNVLGVFWIATTGARILWHFASNHREPRIWEGATMLLILVLSATHLYYLLFTDKNHFILERAQPFLLVALGIGFFAGRFHLFRSAQQIAEELRAKVALRETELTQSHAREKVLVREQAFSDERQRIMRDMHDGLGSQLMGMLLAARRGKAEPERVAEGLQQVIDELRLMIDSMDSVRDTLGVALAGLRTRLQPRVEDAGFALEWDNQIAGREPAFPPRRSLQLFRVVQEAVANALKHSGGSRILITLREEVHGEREWLAVSIEDDGSGMAAPRAGGHGLENMRVRARRENGTFELTRSERLGGSAVRIAFPFESEEPDAASTAPGQEQVP